MKYYIRLGMLKLFLLNIVVITATSAETTKRTTHGLNNGQTSSPPVDLNSLFETLSNQNGNSSNISGLLANLLRGVSTFQPNGTQNTFTSLLTQGLNAVEMATAVQQMFDGVSGTCQNNLLEIVQGVSTNQLWALQILDAFGKPERGILRGDLIWLGNFQQCLEFYITPLNVYQKPLNPTAFETKNCRVNIPLDWILAVDTSTSSYLGNQVTLGSCVPNSCGSQDIVNLVSNIKVLMNVSKPSTPSVECLEERPLETDGIVVICILTCIGCLMVIGTIYDVITVQMKEKKDTDDNVNNTTDKTSVEPSFNTITSKVNNGTVDGPYVIGQTGHLNGAFDEKLANEMVAQTEHSYSVGLPEKGHDKPSHEVQKPRQKGTLEKIVLSFSVYTNGVKILSTNQAAGSLGAVNGIRFLSMCWVILGHTDGFIISYSNNMMFFGLRRAMERLSYTAILNGTLSVDTFFTLSGLLVAYLTLREIRKLGGPQKLNWFMFYFHRFWRLTPAYMLVMMVGTVLYPLVVTGPMRSDIPVMGSCKTTWWTNLFYINNLVVDTDEGSCMGWGWYLANDMQFYVLSPLLLLPLFFNVFAGIASCLVFLSVTTALAAYITYTEDLSPQMMSPFLRPMDQDKWMKDLYIPCYTRMGPYIIGTFTGYILYKYNCKCRLNKVLNIILWVVAIAMSVAIIYSLFNKWDSNILNVSESTAYNALARTGWGVVVSWVVFACATGNGGWINELLSWKAFIPLGRLSYCAYLIHPIILTGYQETLPQQFHATDLTLAYLFVGHLVFSYGGAFLTSLAFEAPMMGLEKAIFKKK